ncbi:MAG: hypothetical protein A3F73_09260 [Gallionellales bacterium RIFCSPLOWO2_12_FULL_59_22]|nr:MAG: hypothetical protein A3F73_09260 [Gallionellales bacterium RIFCSPLOWO2_12_FULL_59_22]
MTSAAGHEVCREGEVDYSRPVHRALLRDGRLSFAARGLFAFLWDCPKGWRANSVHLAKMSPQGRDAVQSMLRELRTVGAMRDEAVVGEGGRLIGRRWILVSPARWAVESPLLTTESPEAAPEATLTDNRVFRPSGFPTVGKSTSKVLLAKGFAIKSSCCAHAREPSAARLWLVENPQDEILEAELLVSVPGGCDKLNAEAAALIKAGKRPYLSTIKKILDQRNKAVAARRQAEQAASRPALSPDEKAKQLQAANLRGALRLEQNSSV